MEAMKDLRYLLPPIVRGMAHDGETSLMVATVQLEEPAELMLAAPLSMDQSTVALWRSAFTGFCSEHARYPRTIAVAGQPWAVALGATPRRARQAVRRCRMAFPASTSEAHHEAKIALQLAERKVL